MKALREVSAFVVVGFLATVTHYAVGVTVFYALDWGLGVLTVNFVAFSVAFLVTYFGNAIFVFPGTRLGPRSFLRFLAVSLVSLALNQGIVYVLVDLAGIPYWQALIAVLLVVPPATFLSLKFWGIKGLRPDAGGG